MPPQNEVDNSFGFFLWVRGFEGKQLSAELAFLLKTRRGAGHITARHGEGRNNSLARVQHNAEEGKTLFSVVSTCIMFCASLYTTTITTTNHIEKSKHGFFPLIARSI